MPHLEGLEGRVLVRGEGVDVDEAAVESIAPHTVVVDRVLGREEIDIRVHISFFLPNGRSLMKANETTMKKCFYQLPLMICNSFNILLQE